MSDTMTTSVGLVTTERAALPAVIITGEQIDLIKTTIAKDATDAELQLFFYDCRRRGVHPLDKLIHFTKRGGKYTPVTSIDYFRSRAAETGEHMGTDDAVFSGALKQEDFSAQVTVYRLVQGQRVAFTATARWPEYCPEKDKWMWEKMPHGQLGKCAEALALRKAFPQQLADLHSFEEMAQADDLPVMQLPKPSIQPPQRKSAPVVESKPVQGEVIEGHVEPLTAGEAPSGVYVQAVKKVMKKKRDGGEEYPSWDITFSDGKTFNTIKDKMVKLATDCGQHQVPVEYATETTDRGYTNLTEIIALQAREPGDER